MPLPVPPAAKAPKQDDTIKEKLKQAHQKALKAAFKTPYPKQSARAAATKKSDGAQPEQEGGFKYNKVMKKVLPESDSGDEAAPSSGTPAVAAPSGYRPGRHSSWADAGHAAPCTPPDDHAAARSKSDAQQKGSDSCPRPRLSSITEEPDCPPAATSEELRPKACPQSLVGKPGDGMIKVAASPSYGPNPDVLAKFQKSNHWVRLAEAEKQVGGAVVTKDAVANIHGCVQERADAHFRDLEMKQRKSASVSPTQSSDSTALNSKRGRSASVPPRSAKSYMPPDMTCLLPHGPGYQADHSEIKAAKAACEAGGPDLNVQGLGVQKAKQCRIVQCLRSNCLQLCRELDELNGCGEEGWQQWYEDKNKSFRCALIKYKLHLDQYKGVRTLAGVTALSGTWRCNTCGSINYEDDKACPSCADHPKADAMATEPLAESPRCTAPRTQSKKAGNSSVSSKESSPAFPPKDHAMWYFQEAPGDWRPMDFDKGNGKEVYRLLEYVYDSGSDQLVIYDWGPRTRWIFNVKTMTQTNEGSKRVRSIKREGQNAKPPLTIARGSLVHHSLLA